MLEGERAELSAGRSLCFEEQRAARGHPSSGPHPRETLLLCQGGGPHTMKWLLPRVLGSTEDWE